MNFHPNRTWSFIHVKGQSGFHSIYKRNKLFTWIRLENIDAIKKSDVIELSFVTLENWVDTGIYMRYTYYDT